MQLNFYHKALIIVAIGIFYTSVPLYVYENHGLNELATPKNWGLLFCLFSLPVLLRQMTATNALNSPVVAWCFGYALITMLWFVSSSQSETAWKEVRTRFFAIIQILAFLMIFWDPRAIRLARKALVGGVLFGVALNIFDLFFPMVFTEALGRSAGLYGNADLSGNALVLGMILSVTVLKPRYRALYVLVTGIGVFLTLARAGILAWVIALVGLLFVRGVSLKDALRAVLLGLALVIFIVLPQLDQLITTWERTGVLNSNVLTRLEWFTDPFGVSDLSSWERKYLAQQAWERIADRPFLGSGTGSSWDIYIGTHNQYLSFMLDHGLMGAMILPLLMLAVTWGARGEARPVAIVFSYALLMLSLFTHLILGPSFFSLPLISLMAAMAAISGDQESQRTVIMQREKSVTARQLVNA